AVSDWLDQNGLKDAQRLAETLDVEQRWQTAVETVLGFHLQAVSVDEAGNLGQALASLDEGAIGIIERGAVNNAVARDFSTPLAQYVRSEWSLDSLLAGIYTADSIEQALSLRGQLQAHESIVTAEGVWLGPNWMRMTRNTDEQAGVLQREAEIRDTEKRIGELAARVDDLQQQLDAGRDALHAHERSRDETQASLDAANRQHAEYKSTLGSRETALEQMRSRSQQIETQLGELHGQIEQDTGAVQEARVRLQEAEAAAAKLDAERAQLQQRRDVLRETLDEAREQARADHDAAHQHALRAESIRTELSSTKQAMQRIESQISSLQQRHAELQQVVADSEAPLKEMEEELGQALRSRQEAEEKLNDARKQVQDIEHAMREASDDNGKADQHVQEMRSQLEQLRMDFQGINVRLQTLQEQIDETGFELAELYDALPDDATEKQWQEDVAKLESRIQRLGAINLAAIDEFKERSERKEYLDKQMADLEDALSTLESAINKIDRETRTRFKETFDTVNNGFKSMFPRLFGGGHAYMELTGDDLLSTGITVMARPPGKRNGTIHLLSGGEKALTAVALVFSIFELNPAPFCMLDEVDAPLDDANVSRFCELVKSMSDRIQFIFITHNKVTMELAGQLMGVTMSEPGVSRLVAVDVDEAATMAAM
ncbi:MAG: chromosome segregation protein SMC, partial [Gammaproteobacteria bacterium]|nr:chromosome segregation protein SMC [Gammaproteobacteria bacterium]